MAEQLKDAYTEDHSRLVQNYETLKQELIKHQDRGRQLEIELIKIQAQLEFIEYRREQEKEDSADGRAQKEPSG